MIRPVHGVPFIFLSLLAGCASVSGMMSTASDAVTGTESAQAPAPAAATQAASGSTESWGCTQSQPGHPTSAEERAFVEEVGGLAQAAERQHGVPAAAITAMAIQESGYGWTRMAQETNNLLAWKYVPGPAVGNREAWQIDCPNAGPRDRFVVFGDRAEAVNFVAEQLATTDNYRADTARYRQDRANNGNVREAVDRWVDGIADPYSTNPEGYRQTIRLLMNNPYAPSDQLSAENNLYRLSENLDSGAGQ